MVNPYKWLDDNGFKMETEINPDSVPIFIENAGVFNPISGYGCVGGQQSAKFRAEAPEGLWLAGGAVVICVRIDMGNGSMRDGLISVPDRRNGGSAYPTAQGWARYVDKDNLALTSRRELEEEIIVYTLGGEGDNLYQPCTEIIPEGFVPKGRVDCLNLTLDDHMVYGQIEHLCWDRNKKDKTQVHVGLWDLRELPRSHRLRVIWEDDFPKNLRPGTNPRVLDLGTMEEIARCEGVQGILPINLPLNSVMSEASKLFIIGNAN